MSEINVKQYKMTPGKTGCCSSWIYSSVLLPVCSRWHVWSKTNSPRRRRTRVWFESCPTFGSLAFKCSLSSRTVCCGTAQSTCLPGGHSLGQVSYCQDCCLNTPSQLHTHTHTKLSISVTVSQACNQYTPPLTACTYVMEGKKGGEEEDGKGREEMLEGE